MLQGGLKDKNAQKSIKSTPDKYWEICHLIIRGEGGGKID